MIPDALTEAEADFIVSTAALKQGGNVLDLMCGYGRHALALAARGCSVVAIDSSEAYIQELQERAEGLPITALVGDVATMPVEGSFHAAICMGNSFSFLSRQTLLQLFRQIHAALLPGGMLVINTWMIAEIVFRHFKEREWHQVGPYKYLVESSYRTQPSRVCAEHTIVCTDGSVESLQATDFVFSLSELTDMLAQCGMQVVQVYATPRCKPFQLGDNKAYIVAQKA
ncbi:hypothetical protein BUE76_18355 [Cnuella takakiae]|nr:hypothetical protein BUE76_18355 [Cnuella takakiae]